MTQKFTAEEVRKAGAMLANCAFNLAQCDRLTERERRSLDESRRAWDAAIAAQPVAADTLSKPADSGRVSKTMADDACTAYRLLMDHEEGPCEPAMVAAIEAALAAQGKMEEFARVAASAACPACGSYGPCVDSVACGATAVQGSEEPIGVIVPRHEGQTVVTLFDSDLPIGTKLYTHPVPPASPAGVPDVMVDVPYGACRGEEYESSYAAGWNACRAAMLAAPSAPEGDAE